MVVGGFDEGGAREAGMMGVGEAGGSVAVVGGLVVMTEQDC